MRGPETSRSGRRVRLAAAAHAAAEPRNITPVADYYMSQADIARELGVSNETVRLWRKRNPRGSSRPFPEPDSWTGVDEVEERPGKAPRVPGLPEDPRENPRENSRSVPGWLPSRLPEIRAWQAGMPGSGAGGGRPRVTS